MTMEIEKHTDSKKIRKVDLRTEMKMENMLPKAKKLSM